MQRKAYCGSADIGSSREFSRVSVGFNTLGHDLSQIAYLAVGELVFCAWAGHNLNLINSN